MEDLGLISRERDSGDRRNITARVDDKGLRLLDRTLPALEAFEESRFRGISAERIRGLIDTLAQVRDPG
jgi:DNA-binding MarR family transcriptional regulator